jgi:hypothetical protein
MESKELVRALDRRAALARELAAKSSELAAVQSATAKRIDDLEDQVSTVVGCDELRPAFKRGVGLLQVAFVRSTRGSAEDMKEFGTFQMRRLRGVLNQHGVSEWSRTLKQYSGADKLGSIHRVVFWDVDPAAGAEMCEWLRCEKWTGGCGFIDDKGVTHTQEVPEEFEPTEDLFGLFLAQRAAGSGRSQL